MKIFTFHAKPFPVKRTGLVRSSSDAITYSESRGGDIMGDPKDCKQKRMNRLLSGAGGARGRGFARTGHRIIRGIGRVTQILVHSITTAIKNAVSFRKLVSTNSVEWTCGSHNSFGDMDSVENSILDTNGGYVEPRESNALIFVNKICANQENTLIVELSALKRDEDRKSKSLDLYKRQVQEAVDEFMNTYAL